MKDIQNTGVFFPKEKQVLLKEKETGSSYWGINGENLMFTYFEVPANTEFAEHAHISEQVTFVLEGELFFKIENKTHLLKAGDVIIIPGEKSHKVWTGKKIAKAIDAWSPVNEKYYTPIQKPLNK